MSNPQLQLERLMAPAAAQNIDCPQCRTRNYAGPGCFTCFNCGTRLREVEDWNPTPDEWFAAVAEAAINNAAFVPGQMRKLAIATIEQGGDWGPLFEAAKARFLPVARRILGLAGDRADG